MVGWFALLLGFFVCLFKESMQVKAFPMNKIWPSARCIPSSYWALPGKQSSLHHSGKRPIPRAVQDMRLGNPGSAFWPLTFVYSVVMHLFWKQKPHSSKTAWEENLFYGMFLTSLNYWGERRSINSWKKPQTGRESRFHSLLPCHLPCPPPPSPFLGNVFCL